MKDCAVTIQICHALVRYGIAPGSLHVKVRAECIFADLRLRRDNWPLPNTRQSMNTGPSDALAGNWLKMSKP